VEIRKKRKKKRVSIFTKFEVEKISSTVCQGILKEQSGILMFAKLSAEKESSDFLLEKIKAGRGGEHKLAKIRV